MNVLVSLFEVSEAALRLTAERLSISDAQPYQRTLVVNEEVMVMEVLKVSAKSNPNSVAGALAGVLRDRGAAELQAIGAGALNQAVKAVAIARGFVAPSGVDLICIPAFTDIVIDGEDRTAIKLIVEPR
jgi:stage V sporulation protein S